MAGSEKESRRAGESERARHIAAGETVAFGTTAGTMLLGLLSGIASADPHGDGGARAIPAELPSEPVTSLPSPLPDFAPPGSSSPDRAAGEAEQHADAPLTQSDESPAALHAEAMADSAPVGAPGGAAMIHGLLGSLPSEWNDRDAPDHGFSRGTGSLGDAHAPAPLDLAGTIDQIVQTVTGIVDNTLATVTQTISHLGAALGDLTSQLTGSLTHLTDGLTGSAPSLSHDPDPTGTIEPLAANLLGSLHPAAESTAYPQDSPWLDTGGAIPMTLLHPQPLQLGFLGQPTLDGHDPHDGAFSSLGVHHF
ncbi:hypothetical protein [Bradyrhizobium sp.]|uniref:hypothetical protein n=1 Tax=Bradyrhizobium sp. TaxID=376 RepID=UPI004037BD4C